MAVSMLHTFLVASAVFFNHAVNGQMNYMITGNGWGDMNGWDVEPEQWEDPSGGGWNSHSSGPWGGGDSWGSSGPSYEPTAATCHVADAEGNGFEVVIEPGHANPWASAWGGFQDQGGVSISIHIHSSTLEGKFTIAVTELSTDYVKCETGDLGYVQTSQPSTPNLGFWGMIGNNFGQRRRRAGLKSVTLEAGDDEDVMIENNHLYRSFHEFRGRGLALCTEVEEEHQGGHKGGWNGWGMMQQRQPRYVCEHPVLCCKLGLASAPSGKAVH
ncbi:hypothetical protein SNE40_004679 [Patella caerulea]|uniref:Uncharacterized protein n=1 Tax=Patella caerulea TaxID=87958 RepID=A0AAN8JYK1_PATCE